MPHNQHLVTKSVLLVLHPRQSMTSCVGVQSSHSAINHEETLDTMCAPQHTHTQDCASCSSSPRTDSVCFVWSCSVMVVLAVSNTLHLHKHIRATRFTQPHCTPPITTHRVLVLCSTNVAAPCCLHRTTPTSMLHLISQTYCLQRLAAPLVPTLPVFFHRTTLHPPSGVLITTTQCAHKHSTREHTRTQTACSTADVPFDATTQQPTCGRE